LRLGSRSTHSDKQEECLDNQIDEKMVKIVDDSSSGSFVRVLWEQR
jgi:hypothetical protein